METARYRFIGRGLYSLAEAHRLTGVPKRSIRRWISGYYFPYVGSVRHSPPVVVSDLPGEIGLPALDFADLLEVRFLHAFRAHGVSWKAIRVASERARELLGIHHPFSSRKFSTDGHTILAQFVTQTGDEVLLDLVRSQYEFKRIISSYLFGEIDFDNTDAPKRWYPFVGSRRIVIDPQRALGAPVVARGGVPTRVLAKAVEVEGSPEVVSNLFEIDLASVEDAYRYELSRSAE
jgi:uncharacterized protein (DUF433 family)